MDYGFDRVTERRGTACVKYDAGMKIMKRDDLLPLWVADMDFRAPEEVLDAIRVRTTHGIFGYTEPDAAYERAVASWFLRRHGWEIHPGELTVTPGVVFAIAQAILAYTAPGDPVLIQKPVYHPFEASILQNGRRVVNNALLLRDGRYELDLEDFEQKLREEQIRLFILCSPHNPVGRVWTEEELLSMAELCRKYGVTVVSDEIHCDFIWPGHHFISWARTAAHCATNYIICTSPSKSFNLAGMQTANIIIPDEALRERFRRQLASTGFEGMNPLGMVACEAAYEKGEPWFDALLVYLKGNIDFVKQYLADNVPDIRVTEPEGCYLLWIDFSGLGLPYPELKKLIIEEAKIWLNPGKMFGIESEQFMRLNTACPRSVLRKAMEQLAAAVESAS